MVVYLEYLYLVDWGRVLIYDGEVLINTPNPNLIFSTDYSQLIEPVWAMSGTVTVLFQTPSYPNGDGTYLTSFANVIFHAGKIFLTCPLGLN